VIEYDSLLTIFMWPYRLWFSDCVSRESSDRSLMSHPRWVAERKKRDRVDRLRTQCSLALKKKMGLSIDLIAAG
jgi:hypothetical protein